MLAGRDDAAVAGFKLVMAEAGALDAQAALQHEQENDLAAMGARCVGRRRRAAQNPHAGEPGGCLPNAGVAHLESGTLRLPPARPCRDVTHEALAAEEPIRMRL